MCAPQKPGTGWRNLLYSDHVTVDKDFRTLCSDYAMRLVGERNKGGTDLGLCRITNVLYVLGLR